MRRKRNINFDANALTMPTKHVLKALRRTYKRGYANPSSLYLDGRLATTMLDEARLKTAIALGCDEDEIFFTSGASESNSWALKIAKLYIDPLSHHSLKAARYVNDNENDKKIISFPWIVSETGECLKDKYNLNMKGAHFFIDITQAIGKQKIDLHSMPNVLMASASGQKFGSVQGTGILYIKKEFQKNIEPLIYGSQECGLRGGTENLPSIVCFGEAIEEATKNIDKNNKQIEKVVSYICDNVDTIRNKIISHGNVINITFNHLTATAAVQIFDKFGFSISAGSACNSESEEPSEAYLASGYTRDEAMKTIRISIGKDNTIREAKKFIKTLKKVVALYDEED